MNVGEKIQEILDWNGMQQKVLAKKAGLPVSTVNGYITKGRGIPIEAAAKMADVLGVSLLTLLNTEAMPIKPLELTEAESLMVTEYRMLTRSQRELVAQIIELLRKQNTQTLK